MPKGREKIVLCLALIFLAATAVAVVSAAAVTESEAEEISKSAAEAAALLSKHPDAFSVVSEESFNSTPCWAVDWWTNEQLERGLQYPNVRVWVAKESGRILSSAVPRGAGGAEGVEVAYPIPYPIPSPPSEESKTKFKKVVLISVLSVAALTAAIILIQKYKKK